MAKLGSYYGLCPLIDQKSLLGVSECDEKGYVIVTLGKNIAVIHKLSDQKQLRSWRTKDKFTSPVIYDEEKQNYMSVFNQTHLRLWTKQDENLDKLKKLKFSCQIQTLFSCGGKSFVVFKNGTVRLLEDALENRKSLQIQPSVEAESVMDILHTSSEGNIYIGLITGGPDNCHLLWTIYNLTSAADKYFKIDLKRDCSELMGYVFHQRENVIYFLTLWSDGKMYANVLQPNDSSMEASGVFYSVIESVNCKQPVSMISLDESYIGLYGGDLNEEGATLVIYNVQFKVTQSKLSLKLFTKGAKLWCVQNNLILPVGQNLAVVPYHLDTEQLAALVGSHKTTSIDNDGDVCIVQEVIAADWGAKENGSNIRLPNPIKSRISEFCQQGLPENTMIEHFMPDIMEKQDITLMSHILHFFCDIPEKNVIQFLKLTLNAKAEIFKNKQKHTLVKLPQKYLPHEKSQVLDMILSKSFSSALILPFLRSLEFDDVIKLIEYIEFMLSDDGHCLPTMDVFQTEKRLIEWACILLDANFQKILLMKDEAVVELLRKFRESVGARLQQLNGLSKFSFILDTSSKGKVIRKVSSDANALYSMELINLY